MSKNSLLQEFDVRVILRQDKRAPLPKQNTERGQSLPTLYRREPRAGIWDLETLGELSIMLQHQANAMGVQPLLPKKKKKKKKRLIWRIQKFQNNEN